MKNLPSGNFAVQKYEVTKNIQRYIQALENPTPSKETTRWKNPDIDIQFMKNFGNSKQVEKKIKNDNIKLSNRLYDIFTEDREGRSYEYAPGWRVGTTGTVIDCYPSKEHPKNLKKFTDRNLRSRYVEKKKIQDQNVYIHKYISSTKSSYEKKRIDQEYSENRRMFRIFSNKIPSTALHLGLFEEVRKKMKSKDNKRRPSSAPVSTASTSKIKNRGKKSPLKPWSLETNENKPNNIISNSRNSSAYANREKVPIDYLSEYGNYLSLNSPVQSVKQLKYVQNVQNQPYSNKRTNKTKSLDYNGPYNPLNILEESQELSINNYQRTSPTKTTSKRVDPSSPGIHKLSSIRKNVSFLYDIEETENEISLSDEENQFSPPILSKRNSSKKSTVTFSLGDEAIWKGNERELRKINSSDDTVSLLDDEDYQLEDKLEVGKSLEEIMSEDKLNTQEKKNPSNPRINILDFYSPIKISGLSSESLADINIIKSLIHQSQDKSRVSIRGYNKNDVFGQLDVFFLLFDVGYCIKSQKSDIKFECDLEKKSSTYYIGSPKNFSSKKAICEEDGLSSSIGLLLEVVVVPDLNILSDDKKVFHSHIFLPINNLIQMAKDSYEVEFEIINFLHELQAFSYKYKGKNNKVSKNLHPGTEPEEIFFENYNEGTRTLSIENKGDIIIYPNISNMIDPNLSLLLSQFITDNLNIVFDTDTQKLSIEIVS